MLRKLVYGSGVNGERVKTIDPLDYNNYQPEQHAQLAALHDDDSEVQKNRTGMGCVGFCVVAAILAGVLLGACWDPRAALDS